MWMMGYNDGGEFNMPDSFHDRKLRPLVPISATAASNHNTTTTNPPCLSRIHGTDLHTLNHHLVVAEQSKREFNTQQLVVSSRWNPTPEQLQTLEELYRRGTRTPTADQIQHITAQLRLYGKIEGKNVFYWFQNHKARERQKRRRQLESASDEQLGDIETMERKESGANRTGFEVEQAQHWAPPTNCCTLAEKTLSIQRGAKAAVPECRADGWIQFDEGELQHRRSLLERNAMWHMMQLSSSQPTHLINSTATETTTTTTPATGIVMDPKLIKAQDLDIFIEPYREDLNHLVSVGHYSVDEAGCGEYHTLQLFPLLSEDGDEHVSEKETDVSIAAMNTNFAPCQFFEFLPLN